MRQEAAQILPGHQGPEHDIGRHPPEAQDPSQPEPAGRVPRRLDHGLEGSPQGRNGLRGRQPRKQVRCSLSKCTKVI